MAIMERLRGCLLGDGAKARGVLDDLISAYEEERMAAAELYSHAQRVPYRQAAAILTRLADSEKRHVDALAEEIRALGGTPPAVAARITTGANHWHRVAASFRKADEKRRRCRERSIHWDVVRPEQAAVLASIADEDRRNRRLFEELLARADSLAID